MGKSSKSVERIRTAMRLCVWHQNDIVSMNHNICKAFLSILRAYGSIVIL